MACTRAVQSAMDRELLVAGRFGDLLGKYVDCPFCGQPGKRTKEHVWAQWLHDTAGAKYLLEGTHGERIPRKVQVLRKDQHGRYQPVVETPEPYAKWLPNVTVEVCQKCNGGWMSRLEGEAKTILGPFILENSTVRLLADDLRTLTTWATKSWMAYALTCPTQQNPFTEAEYRAMAAFPGPLRRSRVWLMHSQGPRAHVGMGILATLLSFQQPPPDLETTQNNTAFAYLAVATVVMVMLLVPEEAPDELVDALSPPMLSSSNVRRSWSNPRAQFFPLGVLPSADLAAFMDFAQQVIEAVGLPTEGLTDADAAAVLQEFLDGADPSDLRQRWGEP